uniref:Uncharacterized protein n=2 Tax=Meloidogyne TaxID=189290 RepID=A0A6V7W3R7_MELEN|nr:unnamed protein product [Meloidogyne enterolobii]
MLPAISIVAIVIISFCIGLLFMAIPLCFLAIISFCSTCIFAGRLGSLSIRQRSLINLLNQFRDEFIVYVNSRFPVPA